MLDRLSSSFSLSSSLSAELFCSLRRRTIQFQYSYKEKNQFWIFIEQFYLSRTLLQPEAKNNWIWKFNIRKNQFWISIEQFYLSRSVLQPGAKNNLVYFRSETLCGRIGWREMWTKNIRKRWEGWEFEKDKDEEKMWRRHRMRRREVLCSLIAARYHLFLSSKHPRAFHNYTMYYTILYYILYTI